MLSSIKLVNMIQKATYLIINNNNNKKKQPQKKKKKKKQQQKNTIILTQIRFLHLHFYILVNISNLNKIKTI